MGGASCKRKLLLRQPLSLCVLVTLTALSRGASATSVVGWRPVKHQRGAVVADDVDDKTKSNDDDGGSHPTQMEKFVTINTTRQHATATNVATRAKDPPTTAPPTTASSGQTTTPPTTTMTEEEEEEEEEEEKVFAQLATVKLFVMFNHARDHQEGATTSLRQHYAPFFHSVDFIGGADRCNTLLDGSDAKGATMLKCFADAARRRQDPAGAEPPPTGYMMIPDDVFFRPWLLRLPSACPWSLASKKDQVAPNHAEGCPAGLYREYVPREAGSRPSTCHSFIRSNDRGSLFVVGIQYTSARHPEGF